MNSHKALLSGLAVLLIAALMPGLGLFARPGPPAAPAAPDGPGTRVGMVDLFRVLKEARPFIEDQEAIRSWIDKEQRTNLGVKKSEIEALDAELEMLEGESEQRRNLLLKRDLAKLRFDHEFEHLEQERGQRISESQKRAFAEVRQAVAEAAKADGIELVLQFRSGPLSGLNRSEITSEMYLRNVLYSEASLDITNSVITILDAKR